MTWFLLRTISFRHLVGDPLRTLLVLVGIALGVAVFASVRIANVSALAAFRSTVDVISGPANLIVRPTGGSLPDTLFPRIREVPGVEAAAPRVEGVASITGRPGVASLLILGVDPFTQADLQQVAGMPAGSTSDGMSGGDVSFLTDPEAIVLSQPFATRNGFRVGSTFHVLINGREKRLRVHGVIADSELSRAFGGDVGVMDIAHAQDLLERAGRIDRIDLHVEPGRERDVESAVARLLPLGVTVAPPAQRMRQAEQMVAAFQLNLTALSLISAVVGVFIIYNALLIAVLRRRREIATLRSLGVTRTGIAGLFLLEAGVLGAIGTAAGIEFGIGLARFTLQTVSTTISALYLQIRARDLVVTTETVLLGVGLGLGSALVAGLAPALEAAATPVAETLRQATAARPARRRAVPWLAAGSALLACAAIGAWVPGLRESRAFGFAGAFALLLGSALVTPALVLTLGPSTQAIYRRLFRIEGDLGVHEIRAALDRSSAVVAALGIAIAMSIGLSIMVASFRRTVQVWIDETIIADLFIGPAGKDVSGSDAVLPPEAVAELVRLPGVAADTFRSRMVPYQDRDVLMEAPDARVLARYGHQLVRRGDSASALEGIAGMPRVLVSENFARKFGKWEGDTIDMVAPTGRVSFTIRGVLYDYTSDAGLIMIDRAVYARLWRDSSINDVALYLKHGVSSRAVRDRIAATVGRRYALQVTNNQELRSNILNIFDQTFAITYALQIVALLVAMMGIGNALLAILLQRQREIGILRAVGASKRQIVVMSLLQATVLATWGQMIGSVCGLLLALHLVYVINRQFFGWTLQLFITPGPFIVSYAGVLAAAVAAALWPARWASGVRISEAVRTE